MRIKNMEQQIKSLFDLSVEFCEPYQGQYGTKDYPGEIFCEKGSLVQLVIKLNELKIGINQDNSKTGVICRHTSGLRDTNQILFKDQETLNRFKQAIFPSYQSKQESQEKIDSAPKKSDLEERFDKDHYISLFNPYEKPRQNTEEKKFFDYKKIFG